MKPESEEAEDKMSNFALHTRLSDAVERITNLEMKTIYKVGFWSLFIKYMLGLFDVFKHLGL